MISHSRYSVKRDKTCDDDDTTSSFCPSKKRRIASIPRVNFCEKITINEVDKSHYLSTTTWLSPNDFTKIKNDLFTTIEIIKLQEDSFGFDTALSSRYCSRGLEDYDTNLRCTKFSTVQRRAEAIRSVLREQERQRRLLTQQSKQVINFYTGCLQDNHVGQNEKLQQLHKEMLREVVLDHSMICQIYTNHTFDNVKRSIDMGRKDSEDALAVYRSRPLPLSINIVPTNVTE